MSTCKILLTEFVTHDVKRFIIEKPAHFNFVPGQAIDLAINEHGYRDEERPFTITSLNRSLVLEFIIKRYAEHQGVTERLHTIEPGAEVKLSKPWGTINYRNPGIFIAAGTGITPFISIFRHLQCDGKLTGNRVFIAHKTQRDIILEDELRYMFRDNLIITLTRTKAPDYAFGHIDTDFLQRTITNFKQDFYLCGPESFVQELTEKLNALGVPDDSIIFEK